MTLARLADAWRQPRPKLAVDQTKNQLNIDTAVHPTRNMEDPPSVPLVSTAVGGHNRRSIGRFVRFHKAPLQSKRGKHLEYEQDNNI